MTSVSNGLLWIIHEFHFKLTFLLRLFSLLFKSAFVTKSDPFNLASKTFAVNLLNSESIIYSSWLWSATFFTISLIFVL